MREILDELALCVGYLSLGFVVLVLLAAIVMNYRPAPKKAAPAHQPVSTLPIGKQEPVIAYWHKDAPEHPHPLHERTMHVDADTADEAWAAISRRAS
jgi:hypothetical protein